MDDKFVEVEPTGLPRRSLVPTWSDGRLPLAYMHRVYRMLADNLGHSL